MGRGMWDTLTLELALMMTVNWHWWYINKLHKAHINWKAAPMKVSYAIQVFSQIVPDAIETCTQDLNLEQFQGSEAIVDFIHVFDKLFDALNSHNPLGKFS